MAETLTGWPTQEGWYWCWRDRWYHGGREPMAVGQLSDGEFTVLHEGKVHRIKRRDIEDEPMFFVGPLARPNAKSLGG